ncbi:FK506-binding protein 15 isoform X2 [Entelurus aequoreus]|uniref:FK506-binding protein 15 isoform X2 n=1 Tax=Entelurus aequoreus TaxID=161455 RepID=UPI002B1E5A46|nr:FK506-binding protein 15 isoform X2 [Entelurus aequoreus]
MFAGDDEDGDFLLPSGGAKLASLFGLAQDQDQDQGKESFQYTAPKQPRKSSHAASALQTAASSSPGVSPGVPAILLATAVQSFRYINGQYVKQGKLGAAILGQHATKEYKLLLYVSQQKQVAAAKIHVGFVFTVQSNNYCTFYDDQRQNWSLMFESEESSSDFCREVCLAKANSCNSLDGVVSQDLRLGEGQAVEHGDSVEVSYREWILQNHTIGQMVDSNQDSQKLLRLKIGAGKVIQGWEEGVLGMKKAGCRLIVVPPHLACGSKGLHDAVPANSTLVFQATIKRVKFSKENGSDQARASSRGSGAVSPAPSMDTVTPEPAEPSSVVDSGRPEEAPVRAKSNSLNEQLTHPDATKAKLISRMARMGQPMLPFLAGVSCDSEVEGASTAATKDQPTAPSPVQISTAAPGPTHVLPHPYPSLPANVLPPLANFATQVVLPGNMRAFQPYTYAQASVPATQLQSLSHVYQAPAVPHIGTGDVNSFLITEARQNNTEIRLSVGKVADKVDQLASKIDELHRQGTVSMGLSSISMDSCMLMQNIQRIIQENECLKKEVFEKNSRIEDQNRKITELINQSQRLMEQSNMLLEQRNDSLKSSSEHNQTRLLQAEQDKIRLREELESVTGQLSQTQLEASASQQKISALQTKLSARLLDCESHSTYISGLESQLQELKESSHAHDSAEEQRRREEEVHDKGHLEASRQLRAELEEKCKVKCEQALTSAREHHHKEMAELQEERNHLLQKLHELHQKCKELETLKEAAKETQERRERHLETRGPEQHTSVDTAAEVKRVMNGVFHSLRGDFESGQSYTGHAVLSVIVNTIKNVTLTLLSGKDGHSAKKEVSSGQEEGEKVLVREDRRVETLGDTKKDHGHTREEPGSGPRAQLERKRSLSPTESKEHKMADVEEQVDKPQPRTKKSDSQESLRIPVKPPPHPEGQIILGEDQSLTDDRPKENGAQTRSQKKAHDKHVLQEEEDEQCRQT